MESEFSTDTYTDNSEQLLPNPKNEQIEQLKAQNEHLQSFNSQLQNTIENLRQQLQESLQYKDSISQMGNKIQELNDKIRETETENIKLTKKIQQNSKEREKIEHNASEIIEQLSKERNDALLSSQKLTERLSKSKKLRNDLINSCDNKNAAIEALQQQISNLQKKKKHQNDEFRSLASNYQDLHIKLAHSEAEKQKTDAENKTLNQEIDDLKLQLGTERARSEGNENAIASLNEEIKERISSFEQFESTIQQQKEEINELISQRDRLISIMQNAHRVLCFNEETIESLTNERNSLKQKVANVEKKLKSQGHESSSECNLQKIVIPFDGELGNECQKMLKYEHYRVQQRVQLVINEAAKEIEKLQNDNKEMHEKCENLTKSSSDKEKEASLYKETLLTLLNGLKTVVLNETQLAKTSDIKEDKAFISFVAGKCAELDPIIKNNDINNTKYVPSYLFFSDDVNERINTIQKLIQPNDETFSLFASQFLINSQLKKQLERALENIPEQNDSAKILSAVGLQTLDEIPDFVENIQQQLTKAKEQKTEMRKSLKEAQKVAIKQNKVYQESQNKLNELQLANESIKNENEVLKVKNQVLSNDLVIKTNELNSIQEKQEPSISSIDLKEIEQAREEVEEKETEIRTLNLQIKHLKSAVDGASALQARALRRQESSMNEVIGSLQDQLMQMASECEKRKSKNKKLIKSMQRKHQNYIEELTSNYEESKEQFNKSLAEMTEKTNKTQEMSQKLIVSLQETEKKVQNLSIENNKLQSSLKTMELKLLSAEEKLAKEKQNSQSQIAAQSLLNESKVQKRVLQIKAEINEQKKSILNIVGRTIGSVYGIDPKSLDEQSLEQLVQNAQKDLEKLRMFQSETPTYIRV